MNSLLSLLLRIAMLAMGLLLAAPAKADYAGGDNPQVCYFCKKCDEYVPLSPGAKCSAQVQCDSENCASLTEGTTGQSVPVSNVSSSTGPQLQLSFQYDSYNADGSRARFDTVAGIGWTHSYNAFLYSMRGHMFRVGGDGRITKYQLGANSTFTAATGYFEKIVKNPDGSFTITMKDQTAYRYEQVAGTPFMSGTPVWRLTRITDRNANVTSLSYSAGKLDAVTDTYGRQLRFTYNAKGKVATVTDPANRVTQFVYDAAGVTLLQIIDPEGKLVSFTYNTLWQFTRRTDKDGRVFTYSYTNNKPTGISDSTGAPYFTLSNPNNWATDATALALNVVRQYVPGTVTRLDGRGNAWTYDYESHGYVTRMAAPDGATWRYTYDPATLRPASQLDANGRLTSYKYDAQGNLLQTTNALGHVTSYTYEPVFNQMTSMTDANSRVTTWTYDARGNRLTETDPLLHTRNWTYDNHGNVLSETDKNGNLTRYEYDALGNRTKTTDAALNVTAMAYDAVGNLVSVTNPNGHTTAYQYDGLNRLTKEARPLGEPLQADTSYTYDGQGDRLQRTDRNGNVTIYQYDQRRRLVSTTDALGHSETQSYDANNDRVGVVDRNGHLTRYDYDVQNRPIKVTDALGNFSTTAYDGVGNKLSETDANLHTTAYQYDALNRLTRATDAEGQVTQMAYDGVGGCVDCTGPTRGSDRVTRSTDAEGKLTYFKYDGMDRLILRNRKQTDTADTMDGNDAVTRYSYDALGNRVGFTEPNLNATTYAYDSLNREKSKVNAAGDTTVTTYDPDGNVATVTTPNLNLTRYSYDALDRLVQVDDSMGRVANYSYDPVGNRLTDKDGNGNGVSSSYDAIYRVTSGTDALGKSSQYTYDAVGNRLTTTDREGRVTAMAYDDINRRTQVTDALGHATKYEYDKVGNLKKLTDANGHTTSYSYDGVDRLKTQTYADGNSRSYTYDGVSNVKTRTDQKGQVTTYSYSDLHYLTSRSYPVSPADTMTYDLSGRLLTANRGGWLVTFVYDGANRVTQTQQNGQALNYAYDIPGRTRTLTYPGGRVVKEATDARSRLDRIDDAASPTAIASYSYDAGNRVLTRSYRNGTLASYSYNANNWTTSLDHSLGATRIAGVAYDFDNEGNKRFENKLADGAGSNARSEAYQYDSLNRLVDYKVGSLVGSTVPAPATQTQYSLDAVGNWNVKTKDLAPEARTHSVTNEITQIAATAVSSDLNGNTSEDGQYRYAYDEENRLTGVTRKADSRLVGQYQYDALSRRVRKTADAATPSVPTETRYFYDNSRIVEEQSPAAATLATYVYGSYVDDVLTMERSGSFYYHRNSLWSVEAVSNAAGLPVERYAYDAYGQPTVTDGAGTPVTANAWGTAHSAIANPWAFTGRQLDEEAGLYFYRARYYDPVKGRFLQRDPMGYVDGLNLYAYVRGAPTVNVDPSGLCCKDLCSPAGAKRNCKLSSVAQTAVGIKPGDDDLKKGTALVAKVIKKAGSVIAKNGGVPAAKYFEVLGDALGAAFGLGERLARTRGFDVWITIECEVCKSESCYYFWTRLNWQTVKENPIPVTTGTGEPFFPPDARPEDVADRVKSALESALGGD